MATFDHFGRLHVIAPNFKRRLSGVTSTIIQLVPAQNRLGTAVATLGPGLPEHLPKLRWRDVWKLWTLPDDGRPRIWHARRNIEMITGLALKRLLRLPVKTIFTCEAQRHHKALTRFLMRNTDRIITTNSRSAAYIKVPYVTIAHGTDTERFVPPADKALAKAAIGRDTARKLVGCTGRVRASKGTDLAVDAFMALADRNPDWDMVITGRATAEHAAYKNDLEARIAAQGLQDRIRFVGEVDDLVPWYQAFDLFVAPSRNEGYGLTPLEAMACGVPCVTSDAGAYRDMITDHVHGLCVAADDRDALRDAMGTMMGDNAARATMASQVRDHVVSNYSLDAEAAALNAVYRELRGAP